MKVVRTALAATYHFTRGCGIIVIAVALLAMLVPKESEDGRAAPADGGSDHHVVMSEGRADPVRLHPGGDVYAGCTLVDDEGRRLLEVEYDRSGCLRVRWGDSFPVRPSCSASRDGRVDLYAWEGTSRYGVVLRPNGVSGVTAVDPSRAEFRGLGYTKDGELTVDPWMIGKIRPPGSNGVVNQVTAATASKSASSAVPGGAR